MKMSTKNKNIVRYGVPTEARHCSMKTFYKVTLWIESITPQNKGCASYL